MSRDDNGSSPVPGLSLANWAECEVRAIRPEIAIAAGLRDCVDTDHDGLIVPYRAPDGERVTMVYRLTAAEREAEKEAAQKQGRKPRKYRWPLGVPLHFAVIHDAGPDSPVVLVEGTLQPLAVASWIAAGYTVLGMNGADGYHGEDLTRWAGRRFYVWPDQDIVTNRGVWDGMHGLAEMAAVCGITDLKFIMMPARGNEGADDFLHKITDETKRTGVIDNLLAAARDTLPRRPAAPKKARVRTGPAAVCFDADGNFLAATAAQAVLERSPAALTAEGKIAMYAAGVYKIDGQAFTGTVVWLLGEEYRGHWCSTIEDVAINALREAGAYLPERADDPIVNLRNTMLDLRSGELLDHDPKYLSGVQLSINYDPAATCPTYDRWIEEVCPDQVEDLDEVCSQMIDPSRCPTKAVFNYGPSRSGKSTHLRLLEALAGPAHRSAVTLHQLSEDGFASANVYGSILNAAADLSSAHVEDLSKFKMLTGADSIHANRKYGAQFMFRNRALFAFSANELPTVSENSRAYSERIKPFHFNRSFAGHEDQSIEDRMMGELPGIFNRLVAAWQRRDRRKGFLDTAPAVRADFETKSDRVLLWLSERGRITTLPDGTVPAPGQTMPADQVTKPRNLSQMFNTWAREQGGSPLGERRFIDRLTSLDDVERVRDPKGLRGLNIRAWPVGTEVPDEAIKPPAEPAVAPHLRIVREEVAGDAEVPRATASCSETAGSAAAPIDPSHSEDDTTVIFDLETGSATELHSAGPEWLRLGGYSAGGRLALTTDFADLTRRIEGAHVVSGHNIMGFDLLALVRHHGLNLLELTRPGRDAVFDTLLAARFVDPPMAREKGRDVARRYDLDSLGAKYELGGKTSNLSALAREFGGFAKIPIDDQRYRDYLAGDIELSRKLYHHLHGLTGDSNYLHREHRVAAVAASMTINGFRVDLELLNERLAEGERRKSRALRRLHERYGIPLVSPDGDAYISPLATKAGKAALVEALVSRGVSKTFWTTTDKTGDIATSREAMAHLAHESGVPEVEEICKLVATVVSVRTVYQTIRNCLDGDRVHPTVTMKQSTGRWSLTRPGLTVMGKRGSRYREREVFIAEPGHVIIAIDLSQVDMRAIAGLSGDEAYIDMLRHEDPHAEIAKLLFGSAEQREEAKKIGHGWNYGRGIKGICTTYDLEAAVVRQFDESMRERFPGLVQWQDDVRSIAESGELLDNGFGRPMRPDPMRAHTQGPALMGQGCARDIMMTGLLRLPHDILPMLRAQVHDEVVLSVPASDAVEIQRDVIAALSFDWEGPGGTVPIVAQGGPTDRTSWGAVYAK